jgi:hypothetical protein
MAVKVLGAIGRNFQCRLQRHHHKLKKFDKVFLDRFEASNDDDMWRTLFIWASSADRRAPGHPTLSPSFT